MLHMTRVVDYHLICLLILHFTSVFNKIIFRQAAHIAGWGFHLSSKDWSSSMNIHCNSLDIMFNLNYINYIYFRGKSSIKRYLFLNIQPSELTILKYLLGKYLEFFAYLIKHFIRYIVQNKGVHVMCIFLYCIVAHKQKSQFWLSFIFVCVKCDFIVSEIENKKKKCYCKKIVTK